MRKYTVVSFGEKQDTILYVHYDFYFIQKYIEDRME